MPDCAKEKKRVYVIELEGGKYYVGASRNFNRRIGLHTSWWVNKHGYEQLVERSECVEDWQQLEREKTLEYMREYGWQNVRGGPWWKIELDEPPEPLKEE